MAVDTTTKGTTLEALQSVRNRESLFAFLRDELKWNVDPDDTFTYSGPVLSSDAAARVEVGQIVPFGADDPFVIMLAEFQTAFRRSDLREILRAIKADMRGRGKYEGKSLEDIVFVCVTQDYAGIKFAHFQDQEKRQPRLSVFGWDVDDVEETRTLREFNLPALTMHFNVLGEPDWQAIRTSWLSAWDVERVTDEFFKHYREVFEKVESMISSTNGDKRLFTQRLFNRLLFIQFVQKKRWLKFEGTTNYLQALYNAAVRDGENFYADRLYWLFFHGLGAPVTAVEPEFTDPAFVIARRGDVPFLNGGLFELEDEDDYRGAVTIDNEAFDLIINGLFAQYNFTVTESTPLDIEVAVDPEMLGKIFEELVTGRHETGSYYTPKPIVSFMCREALKGYIRERVPGITKEAASLFVDEHDSSGISNPEQALEALRQVKVCDPACGSGAYLLGMLRELLDLRTCLFYVRKVDSASIFERKLEIIQNSLYGVDKDEFAVNIARLRLWLSLVVEYEGEDNPPPLPNLDFKIECGDSIVCPNPQLGVGQGGLREQLVHQFIDKKATYLRAHNEEKHRLLKEIKEIRSEIALMEGRQGDNIPFDWSVDFAEIFTPFEPITSIGGNFNFGYELAEQPEPDGFDIVVANPPYVRQELIKDIKPALKGVYENLYSGTADLYVYFYCRAIQMLRAGGMLTFISSNKWFKAGYGSKLRQCISDSCNILSIIDFGDLPVFQSATAYPMIFIAKNTPQQTDTSLFVKVKSLEPPYPDMSVLVKQDSVQLAKNSFAGANWTLTDARTKSFLQQMEAHSITLNDYLGGRIYYGVKTGLNEAFIINAEKRAELLSIDAKSDEIIKPLAAGKDVRKWRIDHRNKYLIFSRKGIVIDDYPAIKSHLELYKERLEPKPNNWHSEKQWHGRKPGPYKWYEIQDNVAYHQEFDKPKIIYPVIGSSSCFALDTTGLFINDKAFMIPENDLYLLGILNSASMWSAITTVCSTLRGGFWELRASNLSMLPIPQASESDRATISKLVQKCLDAKGVDCEVWEKEIDERVAVLYGL